MNVACVCSFTCQTARLMPSRLLLSAQHRYVSYRTSKPSTVSCVASWIGPVGHRKNFLRSSLMSVVNRQTTASLEPFIATTTTAAPASSLNMTSPSPSKMEPTTGPAIKVPSAETVRTLEHMRLVECVPNFSEGRDMAAIDAIQHAISRTPNCFLLHTDVGWSANRTVFTLVGEPRAVVDAIVRACKTCLDRGLDMRQHTGEHPRLGLMDVCPFIPVRNVSIDDCVDCAHLVAERLANELGISSYLYGYASPPANAGNESAPLYSPPRTVPQLRKGEYDSLRRKLNELPCDYGPKQYSDASERVNSMLERWGVSIIGARKFLAAYNVNLLATKDQCRTIARRIRETGDGRNGGLLKSVQAIGWWYQSPHISQVSTNIVDLDVCSLQQVYETVRKCAEELHVRVIGSELVGLIPKKYLMESGIRYADMYRQADLTDRQVLQLAVHELGLSSVLPFDIDAKVIECALERELESSDGLLTQHALDAPLSQLTLSELLDRIGAAKPTLPGAGSTLALVAAAANALCRMCSALAVQKLRQKAQIEGASESNPNDLVQNGTNSSHSDDNDSIEALCDEMDLLDSLTGQFKLLIDEDATAFQNYLNCPKDDRVKKEAYLTQTVLIPIKLVKLCAQALAAAARLHDVTPKSAGEDLFVSRSLMSAVMRQTIHMISGNISYVKNEKHRRALSTELEALKRDARMLANHSDEEELHNTVAGGGDAADSDAEKRKRQRSSSTVESAVAALQSLVHSIIGGGGVTQTGPTAEATESNSNVGRRQSESR